MAGDKKIYDFDPRNLPPELLQAIGLGVACSAQTESVLEAAIAGCLGIDTEYGMAITTHMPTPLRFHVLKAAAEIRLDSVQKLDELDELLDQLDTAISKRNDFAHLSWATDPETKQTFQVKETARGSVQVQLLPKTVNEVKADAMAIYDIGMRLWTFLDANGIIPSTPPLRPRGHKTKAHRKKLRKAAASRVEATHA